MTKRPGPHFTENFGRTEDEDEIPPDGVPGIHRFWGKYSGVVMNPIDLEGRCRMLVTVPDVWGPNFSDWAEPCLPFAGLSIGMYIVPPIGANVWIEFRHGNPERPIWTGFWYGDKLHVPKTPALGPPGVPLLGIETFLKHALIISDAAVLPFLPNGGGILLRSGASYIAIDALGVRIVAIPPASPQGVQVNNPSPNGMPPTAASLYVI